MSMFRFALIALVLLFSACTTIDGFLFDAPPEDQALTRQETTVQQPVQEQAKPADSTLNAEVVTLRKEIEQEKARLAEVERQQSDPSDLAATASQLWVKISFRPAQTALEDQTRAVLAKVAAKFLAVPRTQRLDIRGYSDGEETMSVIAGKSQVVQEFISPQDLSAERADAVAHALMAAGIPDDIIQAQGYGASNFVDDNTTEAGRNNNRRVEIHLIH